MPRWPSRSRHSRGQRSHWTLPSGRADQYCVGVVLMSLFIYPGGSLGFRRASMPGRAALTGRRPLPASAALPAPPLPPSPPPGRQGDARRPSPPPPIPALPSATGERRRVSARREAPRSRSRLGPEGRPTPRSQPGRCPPSPTLPGGGVDGGRKGGGRGRKGSPRHNERALAGRPGRNGRPSAPAVNHPYDSQSRSWTTGSCSARSRSRSSRPT